MDGVEATVVSADADALTFIHAKGSDVYAWIGGSGFMEVGFKRPADVDFLERPGDGFVLFQDVAMKAPLPHLGWHVSLRRWPRRRIKVEYATPESRGNIDWLDVLAASPWP